jgi:GT2 family glycosyltransferase
VPETATILITTKDRRNELRRAVASALRQSGPAEILVFDDGSVDGTSDMLRTEFPTVQCHRSEYSLGIIGARNKAMTLAAGSIVITIDDDCVFQSINTVDQTLTDFKDTRIGAVAIPHIHATNPGVIRCMSPGHDGGYAISEFTGCASGIRRDVFLKLGGFRSVYWRQCEEYDFCTRLLNAGYVTCCGSADPVLHLESRSKRDSIVFHTARGNILYAWHNVPLCCLPLHMTITAIKSICAGAKSGQALTAVRGELAALSYVIHGRAGRQPVSVNTYRLFRELRANGPTLLDSVWVKAPWLAESHAAVLTSEAKS